MPGRYWSPWQVVGHKDAFQSWVLQLLDARSSAVGFGAGQRHDYDILFQISLNKSAMLNPCVPIRLALLIARKMGPEVMFASASQVRSAPAIQDGTGTFSRARPCRQDQRKPSALRVAAGPGHGVQPPRHSVIRSPTAQRSSHSLECREGSAGRIRRTSASLGLRSASCRPECPTSWPLLPIEFPQPSPD